MSTHSDPLLSAEEYLAIERDVEAKHEFYHGEMFLMGGASRQHNQITCERPRFEDDQFDTLLNPQVIVEVLSDSTEKYGRGKKFKLYRQLESLKEYVLVAQDHAQIERFTRRGDGQWLLDEASGLEATLELTAIDCSLRLADVYAKVEFPDGSPKH